MADPSPPQAPPAAGTNEWWKTKAFWIFGGVVAAVGVVGAIIWVYKKKCGLFLLWWCDVIPRFLQVAALADAATGLWVCRQVYQWQAITWGRLTWNAS